MEHRVWDHSFIEQAFQPVNGFRLRSKTREDIERELGNVLLMAKQQQQQQQQQQQKKRWKHI